MIAATYGALLRDRRSRRLLSGLGISSLGDGMSTVTIAWVAVRIAPAGNVGLFVGLAVAAYTLPGAVAAFTLGRTLRRRPARGLVLANCLLRSGCLAVVVVLAAIGSLSAVAYVALLARFTPAWLLGFDAVTFAFLGVQAWRTHVDARSAEHPADARTAESGFRLLRRDHLIGLIALAWLFFSLYGPVEDALPVYVARDLHAPAGLLGAHWTSFGLGALVSTLLVGALRRRATLRGILLIVAGWGACLVPFAALIVAAPSDWRSAARPSPAWGPGGHWRLPAAPPFSLRARRQSSGDKTIA